MKKFFTLFALLSVGLSASAQTVELTCQQLNYSEQMKKNEDGKYYLRKLFYINNSETYTFHAGGSWGDEYLSLGTGWHDITFRYEPVANNTNGFLYSTINEGTVEPIDHGWINYTKIFLSDDVTFGTYSLEEFIGEIEYTRFCKNEWGTLCLPFDFQPFWYDQFKDVTYYELKSATDEALVFSPIVGSTEDYVNAGTPLVFKLNNSNSNLIVRAWEIYSLNSQASTGDVINGWKLNGTIEETTIANAWVMQNDKIFQIDPKETAFPIKPYRCWFTGERPSGAPLRISVDETEGLQFVEQEDGTVKVSYDLQGRKLNEARKGLMIENGKVIMVK